MDMANHKLATDNFDRGQHVSVSEISFFVENSFYTTYLFTMGPLHRFFNFSVDTVVKKMGQQGKNKAFRNLVDHNLRRCPDSFFIVCVVYFEYYQRQLYYCICLFFTDCLPDCICIAVSKKSKRSIFFFCSKVWR